MGQFRRQQGEHNSLMPLIIYIIDTDCNQLTGSHKGKIIMGMQQSKKN